MTTAEELSPEVLHERLARMMDMETLMDERDTLKAELEKARELLKDAVDALRVELLMNPGHGELSIVDSAATFLAGSK